MTFAILNYEYRKYMKSNKYIAPIIALFSYLAVSFSVGPLSVLSSYSLSAMCLFLIMVWVGFSFNEVKENIIEQVIYLKGKNKYAIWLSKTILMMIISFIFALVSTMYPILVNALNHFHLFKRTVRVEDVLIALLLHFIFAWIGSVIGMFFNEHIVKNRKLAVAYAAFIPLVTVIRGALEQDFPTCVLITWILPPIYHVSEVLSKMEFVNLGDLMIPLAQVFIYIFIEIVVYINLMKFKLYN